MRLSSSSLALMVQNVFNALLKREAWARQRLQAHAGSSLCIEYQSMVLHLQISDLGLFQPPPEGQVADVTLTVIPDKIHYLMSDDPIGRMRAMRINGDVHLARTLSDLAEHLRWDYTEDLSRVVGDVWAHRFVRFAHETHQRTKDGLWRLAQNLSEYLAHEAHWLVTPNAVNEWSQQVRVLRDDAERQLKYVDYLQKRLNHLHSKE